MSQQDLPPPPPGQQYQATPPPGYQLVPKKKSRGKIMGLGCLALIGLIVVIVVVSVLGSSKGGVNSGGTSSTGGQTTCKPAPCAIKNGYQLQVSGLNRNLPPSAFDTLEAGNHFVVMQVTLINNGDSTQSANPFDFKLRDSAGASRDVTFSADPACTLWQSAELAKAATIGPKPLCFQAAGAPTAKLTLIWSPGFFDTPLEIVLP